MRLYHFTHVGHLPSIFTDGLLRTTESNIGSPYPVTDGPMGEGVGPEVVWLLDVPDAGPLDVPDADDTTHGLYAAKRTTRFEVDVPAIKWTAWAPNARMSPDWREIMMRHAGGSEMADHWYVFPAPIRQRRWVEVRDMRTDSPIWTPGT